MIKRTQQRYIWWSYVKHLIEACGNPHSKKANQATEAQRKAFNELIADTLATPDGRQKYKLIKMVLIDKSHTISGAAMSIYVCERIGRQWHSDFIKAYAAKIGFEVCTPEQ